MKKLRPQDPPQIQINHLVDLYNRNEFKAALTEAERLLKKHSKSAVLYNIEGVIRSELGNLKDAVKSYKSCIKINPNFADGHYNLGIVLEGMGEDDAAIKSYSRAIRVNPRYAAALNRKGNALKNKNKLDEAVDCYDRAIEIQSDYSDAYNNKANALKAQGLTDSALENYREAIKFNPNHADAYFNFGLTQHELGNFTSAIESLEKAIEVRPDYALAYNALGNAFKDIKKFDLALAQYKAAVQLDQNYAEAHYNIGIYFQESKEFDAALKSYKQALASKADYADAHYNMGIIFQDRNETEAALFSYKEALKIQPNYPEAQHLVNSLTGQTTTSAPRDYVERIFDDYAEKFEDSLTKKLNYTTPKLIADLIEKIPVDNLLSSVLDLGCGTGLVGQEIGNSCARLEGVDISKSMLDVAGQKNVYTKLIHADLAEYLSTEALDFSLFISADVFVYVGDLAEIFRLIKSRNSIAGKLIFTTEDSESEGFILQGSGRYKHSKGYIESLCEEFGYRVSHFELIPLRAEGEAFISGGLYILDF
ncbi:tetratricopeptide repeat protein [Gammaproteobacteria bacterium]|nr:tetratricopeptide repeat protein [Gammaproteobacteria bacterium]